MFQQIAQQLGITNDPRLAPRAGQPTAQSSSPIDGKAIATYALDTVESYEQTIARSVAAFTKWRAVPAPERGLVVRAIGEEVRRLKEPLGKLVSLEVGKILQEGLGEVQETIDIADFAVGLSRQLYG